MKKSAAFYSGSIVLVLVFTVEFVLATGVPVACDSSPCLNGGVCFDIPSGFICTCNMNFTGDTCEIALDDAEICQSGPCANGGTCTVSSGVFSCECTAEYTGAFCNTTVRSIISETTTANATTVKVMPQTTSGSGSNDATTTVKVMPQTTSASGSSDVDLLIIIGIAVAAAIIVILVVVLIICVMLKGKKSSDKSRGASPAPHIIADFSNNRDNRTPPSPQYARVSRNKAYTAEDPGDDYPPPPSYEDSNMDGVSTFDDNNQLSHENNFDNFKNSYMEGLDVVNSHFNFDMY